MESDQIDLKDVEQKLDVLALDLLSLLDVEPNNPDQWAVAQDKLKTRLHGACVDFLDEAEELFDDESG